jgi:UDP-N-acetylmuramoyl-tripeptide--D-alanyl-D-alanine ligase
MGAYNEGSWGEESVHVSDAEAAIDLLRGEVRPGDVVLVKASRSVGLESVALALTEAEPDDPGGHDGPGNPGDRRGPAGTAREGAAR